MRGRKPRPIEIAPDDLPLLQQIAHSQIRPWYQVRRARILLGIAHGARTQLLAFLTQCDESTVRRTCRRYEHLGLSGLLDSPTRSGRPIVISPPATCPDRRTGLPGARGRGPAHYPLDQRGPGPTGRRRRYRPGHQRADRPPDLARRRLATSPDSLLEDGSPGCPVQAAGREGPLVLRQRRPPGQAGLLRDLRR